MISKSLDAAAVDKDFCLTFDEAMSEAVTAVLLLEGQG